MLDIGSDFFAKVKKYRLPILVLAWITSIILSIVITCRVLSYLDSVPFTARQALGESYKELEQITVSEEVVLTYHFSEGRADTETRRSSSIYNINE